MNVSKLILKIKEEEKTPLVSMLLEALQWQSEEIQKLRDEIARLKGQKPRPKIRPSTLEKDKEDKKKPDKKDKKRAGSKKKKKTKDIKIHEERIIKPEDTVPEGSDFKGYQDVIVQDINFSAHNIKYRLERWELPEGGYLKGKLPKDVSGNHFGSTLRSFILYQHHHANVTQPLILQQLNEIGIYISSGKISDIIIENKDKFHKEKEEILKTGLKISDYINVDDTGARHKGKNGYCTHIGNELFAYFESTESKSRINFLKVLRGKEESFVVNSDALDYMSGQKLPKRVFKKISSLKGEIIENEETWSKKLNQCGITKKRHIRIITEGALLGIILSYGMKRDIVIMSDDAGQFNILNHALCWIHAERTIQKLVGYSEKQRNALEKKRGQIWDFYAELKKFKSSPKKETIKLLDRKFDDIFKEKTCFVSLNKALERIHKNKEELLLVLKRPEIPLHNNLSERDIREYVKKRKISGSTRSSPGRRCRDTFTSLKKTCRKHGISFWAYIKNRLGDMEYSVPYLPDLIRMRA